MGGLMIIVGSVKLVRVLFGGAITMHEKSTPLVHDLFDRVLEESDMQGQS